MSSLPTKINAMRVATYDVDKVVDDIAECFNRPKEDVTLEEVIDWVSDWAVEDLANSHNFIQLTDENGIEIGEL